jgi:aromatase
MPGHTENTIRIDAPLPLVWEMTNDVANWTNLFTEYAKAEVLEQNDNTVRFRLTLYPDEENRVWSWVSERVMDPVNHNVTARRIETGPFEYMNIRWNYEEDGDATRMTWIQDFAMKPTAPVDDAGMTEHINNNSKVQMDIIAHRVEAAAREKSAAKAPYKLVSFGDVPVNRRRGGEIRTLLSPGTVNSTSGFMGLVSLQPGEQINEHYHPYSEEFLYLVHGALTVDLDGEVVPLAGGEGLYIPINVRHRLRNTGNKEVFAVFHLGPLAPRPDLGHVDTEVGQ